MRSSRQRLLGTVAMAGLAAISLAGCKTTKTASPEVTGSISPTAPMAENEWRREVEFAGQAYRSNTNDPAAAIRYARALREIGQRAQASAVLEQATIANPRNKAVAGAYGRALAEVGDFPKALEILNKAHTPDQPDWKILSVTGVVLDQMGRHEEARRHYTSALNLRPDEPSVLTNLGLSYTLSKELPRAEETLRRAMARPNADPRTRQNLAIVIGLQGRFEEAEKIASADLTTDEAHANVAYLRQMVAQRQDLKPAAKPAPVAAQAATKKPPKPGKPARLAGSPDPE
jgi:Flp pilus assembly protein TadD